MPKQTLLGLTLTELQEVVKRLGMPGFSAKQIASWLYDKKVNSIDDMTNLSLKHRDLLKDVYEVGAEAPVEAMRSTDGTVKYLYRAGDKNFVEAVYIPDEDRATLCVSSQVGCKMNCKFCMTGKQGFSANLTTNQIINQINSLPERDKLTNVVMMGMGEPLDNLDEVLESSGNHDCFLWIWMESQADHALYRWFAQRISALYRRVGMSSGCQLTFSGRLATSRTDAC